jgi:uncharacterized membrane protein
MSDIILSRLDELMARLTDVEARLETLERMVQAGVGARPRPVEGVTPPPPTQWPGAALRAFPPPPPPPSPMPPPPPAMTPRPIAPVIATPAAARTLETMIGRNWTSWVGGIVVVLGVVFFLKYARDQGWLMLSPMARVMIAVGAGVALGIAGEWVCRLGMRVLSAALSGAGVAVAMAAFFAAPTLFDPPVFSTRVAFIGVCALGAVGIWRSLRINAISVAVIAMLGAYLAPAILRSGRDESLILIGYLGALAVVGWSLAYLKPRWGGLRWFTWACTTLWMAAWIIWYPLRGQHRPLALAAVAFFFAGFIGECFLTLHRAFRMRNEADEGATPRFTVRLENSLSTLSMLTTAGTFGACYALLRGLTGPGELLHLGPATGMAIGLAAVHAMIASATPSRQFSRSSWIQAGALVTLAAPLALGRVAITLSWLTLSLALAGLGWRRPGNRALRVWAIVLLGLGLVRVFSFDLMEASLRAAEWRIGEQEISPWLLLAWGTAAFSHVVAWLCASVKPVTSEAATVRLSSKTGLALSAIGTAVFFAASAASWNGAGLTLLLMAWVAATLALAHWGEALAYAQQAAIALLLIAVKWVIFDALGPIVQHWAEAGAIIPVWNLIALAGALLVVMTVWLGRWAPAKLKPIVPVAVAGLGFAWLNFETLRAVDYFSATFADFVTAKQVALSVLWAVVGLAAVVVGFARHLRPLRYAALTLLGVTLVKILLVDLAQIRPVYRILSFLAVGGLLLCVSFVYHRQNEERRTLEG